MLGALEAERPGTNSAAEAEEALLWCAPPCKASRCMVCRELNARACEVTAAAATVAAAAEGDKANTAVMMA